MPVAYGATMRLLVLLALLAPAACASENQDVGLASPIDETMNVHTAANPSASFDRYRTFSFGPSEEAPPGHQTPVRFAQMQRRLQSLIAAVLTQKGYVPASGEGDFFVMFGSSRREVSPHESSSIGMEWLPDDEDADFAEGALVIDAFDAATGGKIWHGATSANIRPDRIDDHRLRRSVQELLAPFPTANADARGGP